MTHATTPYAELVKLRKRVRVAEQGIVASQNEIAASRDELTRAKVEHEAQYKELEEKYQQLLLINGAQSLQIARHVNRTEKLTRLLERRATELIEAKAKLNEAIAEVQRLDALLFGKEF